MIPTILILLSHMVTFAVALLPIVMMGLYKRVNSAHRYDYLSMLRVATISVNLIIISAYKVIYIALFAQNNVSAFNGKASLFFAITFIVCTFLSIYFIIDRATLNFKARLKKIVLNTAAGITVLLAIFTIFLLVSQSQETNSNYIDLAIHYMYPILTGVLALAGIISLIFFRRIGKSAKTYSIIFVSSIPLIILDLIFAQRTLFILTAIPYIAYVVAVFVEVFSGAPNQSFVPSHTDESFKTEYDLTQREIEVFTLAAKGMSNREISEKLFLSVHTVKTHMQHIYSKLNIKTRYQLINFAKENDAANS